MDSCWRMLTDLEQQHLSRCSCPSVPHHVHTRVLLLFCLQMRDLKAVAVSVLVLLALTSSTTQAHILPQLAGKSEYK